MDKSPKKNKTKNQNKAENKAKNKAKFFYKGKSDNIVVSTRQTDLIFSLYRIFVFETDSHALLTSYYSLLTFKKNYTIRKIFKETKPTPPAVCFYTPPIPYHTIPHHPQ
jgi:hypothetical protein